MKKFLILYRSSVSAAEQIAKANPEQAKAGMELWMNWSKKNGQSIVDMGAPLGNDIHINASSNVRGESHITGFSILQAESIDAVKKIMDGHPHFHAPSGSIEVLEFLQMPGM